MSRKKKSKSDETVQATLGELLGEEPKKAKNVEPFPTSWISE